MLVHPVDARAHNPAAPEEVEAREERVPIVHVVRREQLEEVPAQQYRRCQPDREDGGANHPESDDEENDPAPEVWWHVGNRVVVLNAPLRLFRLLIENSHDPGLFLVDRAAVLVHLNCGRLVFGEGDVITVGDAAKCAVGYVVDIATLCGQEGVEGPSPERPFFLRVTAAK